MNEKLELIKEVKEKTLERVVREFGTGLGELNKMKLSIWDVRNILYEECITIAQRLFDEENKIEKESFDRSFK